MSKKSSLSFSIKKSLLVGTIGAATVASTAGCTELIDDNSNNAIVNPVPNPPEDAGSDASDADDQDTDDQDTGDTEDAGEDQDADDGDDADDDS